MNLDSEPCWIKTWIRQGINLFNNEFYLYWSTVCNELCFSLKAFKILNTVSILNTIFIRHEYVYGRICTTVLSGVQSLIVPNRFSPTLRIDTEAQSRCFTKEISLHKDRVNTWKITSKIFSEIRCSRGDVYDKSSARTIFVINTLSFIHGLYRSDRLKIRKSNSY